MKKITLTFLFFLVLGSTLLFGQSGLNGINYQAVARNTNGTILANQSVNVRVSVLSGSATGTMQYQEEHALSTNQLGLFMLQIGQGKAVSGAFSAVPWKDANQYLRVELAIGSSPYSDLGTSQLMSVPYALYAANPGKEGPQGLPGIPGIAGAKGDKGDQGEIGLRGATGLTGPIGLTGAIGPQGLQGIPGVPGVKGDKGDKGDQGEIGLTGPIGPVGPTGPIGIQGLQGIPGIPGVKGDKGDKGDQGEIGLTGPIGPVGPTGPIGLQGLQGIPGVPGVKGDKGDKGDQGEIGSMGPIGPQGIQGIQGIPGTITATAGGDLSGTFPDPVVVKLQSQPIAATVPVLNDVLKFNGTSWSPAPAPSGGGSLTLPFAAAENSAAKLFSISNQGYGNLIEVSSSGSGKGIFSSTGIGFAIHGVTTMQTSAAVFGDNTGGGEAIVGVNNSDIAGAVIGRNGGGGYGVRGFIIGNTSGTAVGVFGQIGLNGSTGRAGRFENLNAINTNANTLEVVSNGNGNITNNTLGNAASFFVNNTNSVAAGVRSEVNTIFGNFGAAAIFGVSSGTGGFAGLFHASNPTGNGTALVATTDGNGNAITANAGKNGNGLESSVDGNGIAVYGFIPNSSLGKAARFVNTNPANTNATVEVVSKGTGTALFVNHEGASGDIAVYQSNATNVARIDKSGKGYFNGGTQFNGADIAESFAVVGHLTTYEPGDILVISVDQDRAVEKSTTPYSSLVAGVYATKPGVLLSEHNIDANLDGEVPMGVIGVIPTKVCLEGGAIARGDLLVSSSIAGVAMKADLDKVKVGQVLGKALENYNANGVSKIKVLVSIK